MITHINYNHFYYFWVVSSEGSIANASKLLHLTPQTISAQIAMLEQRLDKKLFHREGRKLVLTDYGRLTKRYADDMFAIAEEWLETSKGNDLDYVRTIKVGISDALPKSLVSRWLAPIVSGERAVNLICIDGMQPDLLAQLAVHKLDIVLADIPADNNYYLKVYCHEIGKSEIGLFAINDWVDSFKKDFPACIKEKKLLLPAKNSPMNRAIEYWLHERKLEVSIAGHVDDSALMKALGMQGFGIFPAPIAVQDEVEHQNNVTMIGKLDNVFQSYYLFTPERLVSDSIIDELVQQIRQE